jgi:hypothetical protein
LPRISINKKIKIKNYSWRPKSHHFLILFSGTCVLVSNCGLGYDTAQSGSIHMMTAACSSETMVSTYQTTRYSKPGDKNKNDCNKKKHIFKKMFLDLIMPCQM